MKEKKHFLKTSYLDEQKKEQILLDIEAERLILNNAVSVLRTHEIEIPDTETLRKVSDTWLKELITTAYKKLINSLGGNFMPRETRMKLKEPYDSIGIECEPFAKTIERIVSKYPFDITQDSKGNFWFSSTQVKKAAEEQATRIFTDEEKEYYNLIGLFVDAVNELSKFEQEHGYNILSFEGLLFVSPDGLKANSLQQLLRDTNTKGENLNTASWNRESFLRLEKDGAISRIKI